jgi:hypothetical protein
LKSIILPLKSSENATELPSFIRFVTIDPTARGLMAKNRLSIANAYLFGFAFQNTRGDEARL